MDSLPMLDLRVGTVLLLIAMLIPLGHGIMETAVTIYYTGYVRWSQAKHSITITGQIICVDMKNLSNKQTAAWYNSIQCFVWTAVCSSSIYSMYSLIPCYVLAEKKLFKVQKCPKSLQHCSLHTSANGTISLTCWFHIYNHDLITNLIKHNMSGCILKKM